MTEISMTGEACYYLQSWRRLFLVIRLWSIPQTSHEQCTVPMEVCAEGWRQDNYFVRGMEQGLLLKWLSVETGWSKKVFCVLSDVILFTHQHPVGHSQYMRRVVKVKRFREKQARWTYCQGWSNGLHYCTVRTQKSNCIPLQYRK